MLFELNYFRTPTSTRSQKPMNKRIPLYWKITLISSIAAFCSASAQSESVDFGSDVGKDGDGGFTTSTVPEVETDIINNPGVLTPVATWSTELDSVRYYNDGTILADGVIAGPTYNTSLLKNIPITHTAGLVYNVTATISVSTYASDNNRIGVYLFGDSAEVPSENEAGAIAVIYNCASDSLRLHEGIDRNLLASTPNAGTIPHVIGNVPGNTVSAYELDFDITWTYLPNNQILFDIIMTDPDSVETNLTAIVSDAHTYTGDYFGFVSRARVRGNGEPNRSEPFQMDQIAFTLNDIPQSSLLDIDNAIVATPNVSDEIVLTFDVSSTTSLDVDFTALDLTGTSLNINGNKVEVVIPGITDSSLFLKLSGSDE